MAKVTNTTTVINHEDSLINSETLELTEKGKKSLKRKKSPEEVSAEAAHKEAEQKETLVETQEIAKETQAVAIARIKATLTVPTSVFGKKSIEGKAAQMRANTELIITKLADIGPTGTNIVSLRKEGSKRIFYTPMENLTSQGIAIS
jgi:hypothetical protein